MNQFYAKTNVYDSRGVEIKCILERENVGFHSLEINKKAVE